MRQAIKRQLLTEAIECGAFDCSAVAMAGMLGLADLLMNHTGAEEGIEVAEEIAKACLESLIAAEVDETAVQGGLMLRFNGSTWKLLWFENLFYKPEGRYPYVGEPPVIKLTPDAWWWLRGMTIAAARRARPRVRPIADRLGLRVRGEGAAIGDQYAAVLLVNGYRFGVVL